jgi:hypothetical protein
MTRLAIAAFACFALLAGVAHAQQVPGTLLDPTQVDPGLTQAISDYAPQLGLGYVGDCALAAPDVGQVCSEVFQADDGSLAVVLLDAANAQQAILSPAQQADGSWVLTGAATNVPASAAPVAAAPPQPPPPALASPPGLAGPISVSASLSTQTCTGGTVRITVLVTDANGVGVHDAAVTGHVQYKTTGHDFGFPGTDSTGHTSTSVDTGRPRGGYDVVWTVTVSAGGFTATTATICFAP